MSLSKVVREGIYVVAARRTAFGTFGGTLKDLTCTDLAVEAAKAAIADAKISAHDIDSVCIGNVSQTSADTPYLARHVGLRAGAPVHVPALTVNRLCGSGFQSIITGAKDIIVGESNIVLTGGAESMSQAPYAVRNVRWGTRLGADLAMKDTLWETLTDSFCKLPMALTAEKLAEKYGVSRHDCDHYAVRSQLAWAKAHAEGAFKAEIAAVKVKTNKGEIVFDTDEHPRPKTTIESVSKLPSLFAKDGTVTAGNASGVSDGAGVVIIASEAAVKKFNLTPLARLVGWSVAGVDPSIMGIGPVPAVQGLLEATSKKIDDIAMVEVCRPI
jgi:acetyl-CoA acyltransferase 2